MALPVAPPILTPAPSEYSQEWGNNLVDELENLVRRLNTIGPIQATMVQITSLPTSSAGLSSGYLWNDSGTVKVV